METGMDHELSALIERLESEPGLPDAEVDLIVARLDDAFSDRGIFAGAGRRACASSDALLDLVAEALPSWSLHITGHSASVAGRWTCTIREIGVRDDDELIGVGKAETLPHALLAALLKVVELRGGGGGVG